MPRDSYWQMMNGSLCLEHHNVVQQRADLYFCPEACLRIVSQYRAKIKFLGNCGAQLRKQSSPIKKKKKVYSSP